MQNRHFINNVVSVSVQRSYIPTLLYQTAFYELTGSETFESPTAPIKINFIAAKNNQPFSIASVALDKAREAFLYGNNGAQLPDNELAAVLFDYRGCTVMDIGKMAAEQSRRMAEITARSGNQTLATYYRNAYTALTSCKSFKDASLCWFIVGNVTI